MDKIIEKIQKLLALGQSDNEHEASLAMKRANELMEKHQLSMSQIDVDKLASSDIQEENYTVKGQKMKLKWIVTLAQGSAKLFDGEVLVNNQLHGTNFIFVGFADDIELMKALFEHLYTSWFTIVAADLLAAKHHNRDYGWKPWKPKDTMGFKAGHGKSYAETVYFRAKSMAEERKTKVQATTTGTALVLVKDGALADYGESQGWRMGRRTNSSNGSTAGRLAGQIAGKAANMGNSIS
tara:strand:+ start:78 stop:791 length:714 start_codon:yes stop_codon:yes gene_type:complete